MTWKEVATASRVLAPLVWFVIIKTKNNTERPSKLVVGLCPMIAPCLLLWT